MRSSPSRLLLLPVAVAAGVSLACEDPLATLQAAVDQVRSAQADGGAYRDDEAARRAAGGISLGPDHAKRLYYQFVDDRGRAAFVERLEDVPARWRDRVGFVEMDSPPPLSPEMAERTRERRYAANARPQAQTQRMAARGAEPVILYSAEWCGWCKKAKRHLDAKGVDYEIRDVDISDNMDDLVAKTGQRGIPVLDVGGRVVTGFSPDQYDQLIEGRS